jgi:hypothetical protein
MKKNHAVAIVRSAMSFDDHIGAINDHISLLEDGEEKKRIRKATDDVMEIIALKILLPITKQYPDLDLDKYL